MARLQLTTEWAIRHEGISCAITDVVGGAIPQSAKAAMLATNPSAIPHKSDTGQRARAVRDAVIERLPPPEPLDVGAGDPYPGEITEVQSVASPLPEDPAYLRALCRITYTNGVTHREWLSVGVSLLPAPIRALVRQLSRDVQAHALAWFLERYTAGTVDPERVKASKTEVFISHRSDKTDDALRLARGIGDYADHSLFIPRIDALDMQAGNWLDQLMYWIARCPVFMPLLSHTYLSGPISKPELDQALREHYQGKSKKIIPVLVEGEPENCLSHFIGGFHMVSAHDGIDDSVVDDVAHLALGASRNPYD